MFVFTVSISNVWSSEREETICGFIKERFYFFMWSVAAPRPDPSRVAGLKFVEPIEFYTSDHKKLAGYRYGAHDLKDEPAPAKGYVLMALGNAMIADQMIVHLRDYARAGYDAYIYDYRGYGKSEGKRRIKAIIEDYKEIVSTLNRSYESERKLLYGTSLGGAVIMNVIGSGVDYDAAVIDSSPSRLSSFGCPTYVDPVEHLPVEADKILFISGDRDQVLGNEMTRELREKARLHGARVIQGREFNHPFMDGSMRVHGARMQAIRRHLLAGQANADLPPVD